MSKTTKRTVTNPITGTEQLPADLLAEAQKGTPWNKLTDAERDEFDNLSDSLQDKLHDIANTAMIAHGALNSDGSDPNAPSQDDVAELLQRMFGQPDDVEVGG